MCQPQHKMTVAHKLRELSRRDPQFEAIVSYDEHLVRSSLTMEDLYTLSARFAFLLKQEDVLPGDYVASTVPLSLESTIITFGIVFTGAIPTNLDVSYSDGSAIFQALNTVKARLLMIKDHPQDEAFNIFKPHITDEGDPATILKTVQHEQLPHLRKLMLIQRCNTRDQSFIEMLRSATQEYIYDRISPHMTCFIHFTTGSEVSHLKLTEMTHLAVLRASEATSSLFLATSAGHICETPWSWGPSIPYDFLHGTTRIIPDKWNDIEDYPLMLLKIIETEGIRTANLQPVNIKEILNIRGTNSKETLFDQMFLVGMPITNSMLQALSPATKTFTVIYGGHETHVAFFHHIHTEEIETYTDFDVGIPAQGVEYRLVDEDWRDVESGQSGRLLVKTPYLFRCYAGDPVGTAQKFDSDNFFITNDRARMHPVTRHLFVGGRIDSLILHGEYMIYPSWVEEFIAPDPRVREVVVVPVPDDVLFHSIGVCLIKESGVNLTKANIEELATKDVSKDKKQVTRPKHVFFMDDFPRLADGSADRTKLCDIARQFAIQQ